VRTGVAAALLVALCCAVPAVRAEQARRGGSAPAHPCLVVTGSADLPFERNFNPFNDPLDFTSGGIYEPLVVVTTAGGGHVYPWLASALTWSDDHTTLTLTIRHGVRWSDGQRLTSRDVLYTLTAGRQDRHMDQIGLTRRGNQIASIDLVGSDKVAIHLKTRDSAFITSVLANNVMVVPQHVFAHVRHVATWTNPQPVGSGPFAVVKRVGTQAYVLDRNPRYWMGGAPHFACIERVLGSSSDAALLQMVQGGIDLTNNYIPNAQQAYVAHDPAHYHYFYPADTLPIGLYLDDSKYPVSLVAFRKALSMAIDRETLSRLAEGGYSTPVDAIGINRGWRRWMDPATAAEATRLATYDPAAARRALLNAGFSYEAGALLDPHGHAVVIKAKVIESWSDWVTAWHVITRNLGAIGIKVDVQLATDWGDWLPDAFSTRVATLLWSSAVPTPYAYFAEHLDEASFVPSGKDAEQTGDWEHFESAEGTRLLKAFRNTFNPAAQHRIAAKLEQLWLQTMPMVPLFTGPSWSTYSTKHFVGFPSQHDFYLDPGMDTPDYVVALTRIRPA
jgi:peptide/nickel transport system substrate-binding protein